MVSTLGVSQTPDPMKPRPIRAALLSLAGIFCVCAPLLFPVSRQDSFDKLTDEQAARGRWIDLSDQVTGSEVLTSIVSCETLASEDLSLRQLDRTIQRLEGIVLENPSDAVRSNLACILLARARQGTHPIDLIEALEQLELASEAAPERPEVLYNRALVLTRLGLRTSAWRAWRRYLNVAPSSPWSDAAQRWAEELRQPSLFERWDSEGRDELLRSAKDGDMVGSTTLVATYPTFARPWIEERLLPDWAEAMAQGATEEAIQQRNVLRVLSGALAKAIHDSTVEDTLTRIDSTSGETRKLLLEGLRLYGRAMVIYRDFGGEKEKNDLLERAAQTLERAGSPLSRWALFYRTVGWHRSSPEIAFEQLSRLRAVTPPERQPSLVARIEWMLGTNEETQNRYERALEHYKRSRGQLLASEGLQAAAFTDLLIAEVLSELGELDQSWKFRIAAIQGLAPGGDRQRLHCALYSTVELLLLEKRFAAARPWIEEMQANAARWGAALGLAEAALQKGHFLAEQGQIQEAEESFRKARDAAARINDFSLRRRTTATIDLYEAESLLDEVPNIAEQNLERARPEMLEIGYRFQLPRLDSARAQASRAQGDREAALAAFRSAIEEEEIIRREVRDESMRASAFEGAQRAFDALVELELESFDGNERAFAYAEQSRSRALLDLMAGNVPHHSVVDGPVGLERLMADLPKDTDLIEFAVLPHQLVTWWVGLGKSRRYETKITSSDLKRCIDRLSNAIDRNAPAVTIQKRASELWRILLEPISGELNTDRHLVIVPDRFLGQVPFAALFNSGSQRYLLEDHLVTIAPSASAFLAARARSRTMSRRPPDSILAIGANHPGEVSLPTVEGEATSIGSLYPKAEVLIGKGATQDAFLDASRRVEVLHFAGHGKDDFMNPRRSRILFQPARPGDSGILFGETIASEHLPRIRLAVLAACRSINAGTRGRETISGIAAAFLAAGVPTVVASLWTADDRATAELMIAFHKGLRRGLEPGEALRQSQLEMLRPASRFRSPRHWAGFIVLGTN